ncbi:4-hydroxy-2-oxovalerate aldolase [Leptospira kmetyi]|uniref:4-hydroxy-2-oxovalerate aldolase n=1 Tax=Leptospira kmetyi TaxID=408139 RepID=A0ABX4N386_9LEPT|nr:4-hydroxy-2-oxovalerate aldolase [Leptospira kmetyi]EQA54799.1 putative 4-hydroxy-2-oxovalerate aldolase [Leptospira kmetyi serovar Malaysia str. Bejo-Iso9]PJZ27783.1 4-hydroxy-2-oxovalerate aldolase [Leptospira kmetyi]PJZ43103.1 4-hydroxy-2-oxovalerate aldolase [Leptospira kmetyi]
MIKEFINSFQHPILLDCTIRDGGYAINFQFSARDTRNISSNLDKAGIRLIEVGHGLGLGASNPSNGIAFESDEDYISTAKSVTKNSFIGAFFIPGVGKKEDIKRAKDAGLDFIRIGKDVTDLEATKSFIEYSQELGLHVSLNMMKSYAVNSTELAKIIKNIKGWGVDAICLVDSAGCMLPEQISEYVSVIRDHSEAPVGFHGHNNLGMANANSLAALKSGAKFVDATLRGMGRSAGNAQTEAMAFIFQEYGFDTNLDPFLLLEMSETIIEPLMLYPQGLSSMDIVIGISKFHSGHLPRFKRILKRYDVDLRKLIIGVSKVNCINPSDELIESVAKDLARIDEFS